jgi:hypothetical protein
MCENGQPDPKESDLDCGGACAPDKKCAIDQHCNSFGGLGQDANCDSGRCCSCGSDWLCKLNSMTCEAQGCTTN